MDIPLQHLTATSVADKRLRAAVSSSLCDLDVAITSAGPSSVSRLTTVGLGPVAIARYESSGTQLGSRSWNHIRGDGAEAYIVQIPLRSEYTNCQSRMQTRVLPGSFAVLATSRPFLVTEAPVSRGAVFSSVSVRVPASSLLLRFPRADELCNRSFRIVRGASRLMERHVALAIEEGAYLSAPHAERHAESIVDAVANALEWADDEYGIRALPTLGVGARIVERATAFIEAHLSDPALNAGIVADHCGVSARHLHSHFLRTGISVAAHIRELRLQHCRSLLRNLAFDGRTVAQVANLWGFVDASHFSNLYKKRFGHPPRDERGGMRGRPSGTDTESAENPE